MTRAILAELLKLRRLSVGVTVGLAVLTTIALVFHDQRRVADLYAAQKESMAVAQDLKCSDLGVAPGPGCTRLRSAREAEAVAAIRDMSRHRWYAAAVRDPVGSFGAAAGYGATAIGGLLVIVLVALAVGGEWQGRTITYVLVAEPRRWRVLAAKASAIWLVACVCVAMTGLLLWAFEIVAGGALALPGDVGKAQEWTWLGDQILFAPAIVAVFVLVATCLATLTRSALGTLAGGIAALALSQVVVGRYAPFGFEPGQWVAQVLGINRDWLLRNPTDDPFPAALWRVDWHPATNASAWVGLFFIAAAGAVTATLVLSRRDVTG